MEKKLIVLKVGTSSLTDRDGTINKEKIRGICQGAADLRDGGYSVIIVSSGSIAAGFSRLGYGKRPTALSAKQACAAVGQGLLMREYEEMLYAHGFACAQILLTPDAFTDKDKYKNAFSTVETLLSRGAIPIINENDTVATEQIRIGDNDTLSAQVAAMMHAGRLVLLTDVDGLYTANPSTDPEARHIDRVDAITAEIEGYASGAGSANGTGGMTTKLSAARLATASGVEVLITKYEGRRSVADSVREDARGTLFTASGNLRTKE
ncbi:MAG: glutamate 5-kinase, partial [Clostridia bacterium]|nr:glutamate 5-kinase [Clostridia bacterium]